MPFGMPLDTILDTLLEMSYTMPWELPLDTPCKLGGSSWGNIGDKLIAPPRVGEWKSMLFEVVTGNWGIKS